MADGGWRLNLPHHHGIPILAPWWTQGDRFSYGRRFVMRTWLSAVLLTACGFDASSDIPDASHPDAAMPDATTVDNSRVYAHSGGMLYRLNNVSFEPVIIGTLSGLGTQSLTDLAIDKNDTMVGITLDKLYGINNQNGQTALIKDLPTGARGFTSLSFIPENLADPDSNDMLVSANDDGDVFRIDVATGDATKLGNFGKTTAGKAIVSSGDLFGVRGLGIFATVDVGGAGQDFLAKIDPAAGWTATPIGAGTGYDRIFGLGYWNGTIYGFVDANTGGGKVIQIDRTTGEGSLLSSGDVRWFGAGVATNAPIF